MPPHGLLYSSGSPQSAATGRVLSSKSPILPAAPISHGRYSATICLNELLPEEVITDSSSGVREGCVGAWGSEESVREGLRAVLPVSCLQAAPFSWPASPGHRRQGSGLH